MQLWKLLAVGAGAGAVILLAQKLLAKPSSESLLGELKSAEPPRGYSAADLALHRGNRGDPSDILISVKGIVYRVTPQHYGPGAAYECFAGSEATYRLGKSLLGRAHENRDWRRPGTFDEDEQDTLDHWAKTFAGKYPVAGWFVFPDEASTAAEDTAANGSDDEEPEVDAAKREAVRAMLRGE